MATDNPHVLEQLRRIALVIDSHEDWWRFPEEPPVRGFFGTDRLFFVGDRPSTSQWPQSHPNRRAFYGLLTKLGTPNAHITDLYKRRGLASSLKSGAPPDLAEHLALFREEVAVIGPTRIIAMGKDAHDLLWANIPEIRQYLRQIWHFAYPVRYGLVPEWEAQVRAALQDSTTPLSVTHRVIRVPVQPSMQPHSYAVGRRPPTQRDVMRKVYAEYRDDLERVVREYAAAERRGEAPRSSNTTGMRSEDYARALLNDGLKKGWL
jgi:hypothetical protein